jgi:hypothetical protein
MAGLAEFRESVLPAANRLASCYDVDGLDSLPLFTGGVESPVRRVYQIPVPDSRPSLPPAPEPSG